MCTIDDCRRAVQVYYRIPRHLMLSPSRRYRCSHPRQIVMALAREVTRRSTTQIASHFGKRCHTTVMHATRAVARRAARSPQFREDLDQLRLTLLTYRAQRAVFFMGDAA